MGSVLIGALNAKVLLTVGNLLWPRFSSIFHSQDSRPHIDIGLKSGSGVPAVIAKHIQPVMYSQSYTKPNLGTLSILPSELRTKIFSLVLDLFADLRHPPQDDRPPHLSTILPSNNRTALLQASKTYIGKQLTLL